MGARVVRTSADDCYMCDRHRPVIEAIRAWAGPNAPTHAAWLDRLLQAAREAKLTQKGRPQMNMDNLTLGEIRELRNLLGSTPGTSHSIPVGEKVFVRTVTMHYTGRVRCVTDTDIVLDDAAWIPSDGRFATALAGGVLDEVEPYPTHCIVSRGALLDISPWNHELPREQK